MNKQILEALLNVGKTVGPLVAGATAGPALAAAGAVVELMNAARDVAGASDMQVAQIEAARVEFEAAVNAKADRVSAALGDD